MIIVEIGEPGDCRCWYVAGSVGDAVAAYRTDHLGPHEKLRWPVRSLTDAEAARMSVGYDGERTSLLSWGKRAFRHHRGAAVMIASTED